MYKKTNLLFPFFSLLFFISATNVLAKKVVPDTDAKREVWLTVFVHGIMSVKHHLSFNNIKNFIKDEVEDTQYACTVKYMREDPFFYQNQAMQEVGLKKIKFDSFSAGNASAALAHIMDDVLKTSVSHNSLDNHFYTFGWSGLLSPSARYAEAQKLFDALEQELKKFKAHHITPRIRLIGFSHGGNLSLNLAAVKQHKNCSHPFFIDQLVLLGVPIQHDNDYFVNDPIFKQVYHFYSPGDRVQQLDLFSWGNFFSSRTFKERKNFNLPEKLTQICVTMKRPMQVHNSKGLRVQLRKIDPGHTELWLFGWTPAHYRAYSPLYPLPIVALAPAIIQHIEQERSALQLVDNIVTIDMRPHEEAIIFKGSHKNHIIKKILPEGMLAKLKEKALQAKPQSYTKADYQQQIELARRKSQQSSIQDIMKQATAKGAKNQQTSSAGHAV